MMRKTTQSDLSDAEWSCLQAHLPATPKPTGRPRLHNTREILDAIFYVLRSGSAWRLLPRDLERPGRPFTTTSEPGALTAPGRSSTPRHENASAPAPGARTGR